MQNTQYITDAECNAALHTERHIWLFKCKRKKLGMRIYPASQQVWAYKKILQVALLAMGIAIAFVLMVVVLMYFSFITF